MGRILSPGRVSPIDPDPIVVSEPFPIAKAYPQSRSVDLEEKKKLKSEGLSEGVKEEGNSGILFDVRLNLKGKSGGSLVLELNSEVLSASSSVFADFISNYRSSWRGSGLNLCRIEVPEVENLNVFRETIELMFEDDIAKRLLKIGVYRCIDVLEVSLLKSPFTCGFL